LDSNVIRIIVVDDSPLYRQLVGNVLRDVPGVNVVGMAGSGQDALDQVERLAPDLLTLDVNMPGIDGIEVLRSLGRRRSGTKAIMLSGLTAEGAAVTTDALLEGAFDFILKPSGGDAAANRAALLASLSEKIQAFREGQTGQRTSRPTVTPPSTETTIRYDAIVIGTSTGGPVALREILPLLPGDLPVPILVVQHMPAQYTRSLAQRLNEASRIEVLEAGDGMALEPGWAFVAPGGRQMKVEGSGNRPVVRITDDPPENSCRPSVDYLFRSAAEVFGGKVIAVMLTGMGRDGVAGCRSLKQRGSFVIAQHPDGCAVYGMPKAVVDEQLADQVLPLERIPGALTRRVRKTGETND
jgi:two-component system chemotaxis response regulator CheB